MQIARTAPELETALAGARSAGKRVALVPTMGNLHAGHVALMQRARREADFVVASIFVNPLQFGPGEDFHRYPRSLDSDLARLEEQGVDVAFAPTVEVIYPSGYPPAISIRVSGIPGECLEGAFRPGHFDGVATVVWTLFSLVQPQVAVFGEKDWQQLQVIRQMTTQFASRLEIVGEPIVRAQDGLALSSRNQYLSTAERAVAPALHAKLRAMGEELRAGRRDFAELCRRYSQGLSDAGFVPQYLQIRQPDLSPPTTASSAFIILVAAWLGNTRLIDNLLVAAGHD